LTAAGDTRRLKSSTLELPDQVRFDNRTKVPNGKVGSLFHENDRSFTPRSPTDRPGFNRVNGES
jgi:hypothetical protein